jgi:asparagine synthase (glutamine-hydrolysing)
MCGIAGFLGPWPRTLVEGMVSAQAHRGPDGQGVLFDEEAAMGLGHVRLAIIDLTEGAAQPMESACGRYVISYNGEIYNYRALRERLISEGVRLRSDSDTEVLLECYARYGADCLGMLEGIFAFGVWDRKERSFFLARDPLGVKPLYYAKTNKGFLFASELKALVLCEDVSRKIDVRAVLSYLGFLWTADGRTMLEDVRKLRPGHFMRVDENAISHTHYHKVRTEDCKGVSVSTDPKDFCDLFDEVVADQMVADVPVGALLSGGVDSSAVVASMCRTADAKRITAFCAVVGKDSRGADNIGDDVTHAREVAAKTGVNLVEVPTQSDVLSDLPDMLWKLDEPCADFAALQVQKLAQTAREQGVKVLLSGVGADDLLTGYPRHRLALLRARMRVLPGLRPMASAVLKLFPQGSLLGRRLNRLGTLLGLSEDMMLVEAMSFSALLGHGRLALLAADIRPEVEPDGLPEGLVALAEETKGQHPVSRQLHFDINAFVPDHNLNYVDKMSMLSGIEVRVPILDRRLVDYAACLPLSAKIDLSQTKKILRKSQSTRLPESVLSRPKQGFGLPLRSWLANDARDMLEELTTPEVLSSRGLFDEKSVSALKQDFYRRKIDAAQSLFAIMAIELWCRALDKVSPIRA